MLYVGVFDDTNADASLLRVELSDNKILSKNDFTKFPQVHVAISSFFHPVRISALVNSFLIASKRFRLKLLSNLQKHFCVDFS
jgi:hypothetical protein